MRKFIWRITLGTGLCLAGLALYVKLALTPPAGPQPRHTAFTLDGVTLVNPGVDRMDSRALGVRDGAIAAVGKTGTVRVGMTLNEYAGSVVLPGLTDLHTHLPPDTPLKLTQYFGLLYLAHGVTTVRDAGDIDGTAIPAARQAFGEEGQAGPRLFTSGPFIAGGTPRWSNAIVVESREDVRAAVARIKADGFDGVKVYDDLPLELVHEATAAASEAGLLVIGHVPTALAYEEARIHDTLHFLGVPEPRNLGRDHVFNRLADWNEVDDARMDAIVQATLEHGIANTPTLVVSESILKYRDYDAVRQDPDVRLMPRMFRDVVWHPREGLAIWRNLRAEQLARLEASQAKKAELVRRLHAAGAELRIGTDTQQPFVVPGAALHREMELFVAAGIPVEDVWAMATWKAGRALNEPTLGRIALDAPADLLIFREDPTHDLAALQSLQAVVSQGRLYTREDLDACLAAYQRHFNGALFDRLSVTLTRRLLATAVKRDF